MEAGVGGVSDPRSNLIWDLGPAPLLLGPLGVLEHGLRPQLMLAVRLPRAEACVLRILSHVCDPRAE